VSGESGDLNLETGQICCTSQLLIYATPYLVPQTLAGNDGDLIADTLVGLKVEGELGVVSLNDDLGGLLDSLRANATHFGGIVIDLRLITMRSRDFYNVPIRGLVVLSDILACGMERAGETFCRV
jgi:hypothetical protein